MDILTISHFSTEDISKITDYITDDKEREKLKDIGIENFIETKRGQGYKI